MENSNNIFLIGFMGSGKTTLGKRLANKLNKTFFDLDAEIEKSVNKKIAEIFQNDGEDYFRQVETEILNQLINENEDFILCSGGGTPCFNNNMERINQSGTSIYIKHNAGILTSRLTNAKAERPLISALNEQELKMFVVNELSHREMFYKKSKVVIEGDNLKVEDIINLIQ